MLIIQMTGLSGAGKSTLARLLEKRLKSLGLKVEVLDGDDCRQDLCRDLGFSAADRRENIRRLGFVANLLFRNGVIVIIAAINPFDDVREELRQRYSNVKTVWIDCPVEELQRRDTKGLYRRAALDYGHPDHLDHLTGVSAPYEPPSHYDLLLHTQTEREDESADKMFWFTLQNCPAGPTSQPLKSWALFIGRWQPFHHGHQWLIDQKLSQNLPVLVAVRDLPCDAKNPFTTLETMAMIRHLYEGRPVEVIAMPNIESVNYGRGVGYDINCFSPPEDIRKISATEIRTAVQDQSDDWKDTVDSKLHNMVIRLLKSKE